MNILYVAHRVPYPPDQGDKIRAFHQIRQLARVHQVHLVCRVDDTDPADGLDALARYCVSVEAVREPRTAVRLRAARAVLIGRSHSAFGLASRRLREAVARKLDAGAVDAVLAYSVFAAECVRRAGAAPKAVDLVDVVSELWRAAAEHRAFPSSWLCRLEAQRLARYERGLAASLDCLIVSSATEAGLLRRRGLAREVSVVGNGVDLDYFTPAPRPPSPEPPALLFTGTMDYLPNVDAVQHFCRSILPRVRAVVPEARFSIVGRRPTRAVRSLADEPHVTVTGEVPDVRAHLAAATVAVAPFRIARGIQNKILEAMAMGVPVVASSPALAALEASDADGVRRADDPDTFAREVLALVQNPEWRLSCSRRARRYVEHCHRWEIHGAHLSRVLEAMVESRCRAATGR